MLHGQKQRLFQSRLDPDEDELSSSIDTDDSDGDDFHPKFANEEKCLANNMNTDSNQQSGSTSRSSENDDEKSVNFMERNISSTATDDVASASSSTS
ncbi:hypothetical protein C0J52_16918 [Blattella germanica]|nr:hypothetical protein C0J52_16918 [Blattella germanica]